jgi:hypothetical protein
MDRHAKTEVMKICSSRCTVHGLGIDVPEGMGVRGLGQCQRIQSACQSAICHNALHLSSLG